MTTETRVARFTAYVTLIAVIVLGLGGLMVAPAVYSARNNTNEVRRGNELAACRSEVRADVDDAAAALQAANSELVGLLPDGIAAAMNDPDKLAGILDAASTASAELDAAVIELRAANGRSRAAAELASNDPEAFLEQCQEDG